MPQFSSCLPLNALPDRWIGKLRRWTFRTPYLHCNNTTRSIFIHVPKVAGTSVSFAVYGREVGHLTASGYRAADEQKFDSYFKFAFVRHPASRFQSAYDYLISGGTAADQRFARRYLRAFSSRGALLEEMVRLTERPSAWSILDWGHFRPQIDYVMIEGNLAVDFLGRFETLDEDYSTLVKKISCTKPALENLNRSPLQEHTPLTSTEETAIERIYQQDYELLGYPRRS